MERIIRFERELSEDKPKLRVVDTPISDDDHNPFTGNAAIDEITSQVILFECGKYWAIDRFLVIELAEWELKFFIEDRGRIPVKLPTGGASLQDLRILRSHKAIGIYDNHRDAPQVPQGMCGREVYLKLRLLETAPKKLAEDVMWGLFWEMEIQTSYYEPQKSWLFEHAPNYLDRLHDLIRHGHMQDIDKVMKA